MLTIGSLFSGIGGLELGLERAGLGPTMWQVESDPYCRAVLSRHWPLATRYDDVCTVGVADLGRVDLICGGFPCQDVSSAGSRAGLAGSRSGLWREFARVVGAIRPRWVVVENVASGATRWMDAVVGDLEQQGYACLPLPISACDVGAPHRRARVFVVGRLTPDADSNELRHEPWWSGRQAGAGTSLASDDRHVDGNGESSGAVDAEVGGASRAIAKAVHSGRQGRRPGTLKGGQEPSWNGWRSPEPEMVRVADGLRGRVDSPRRRIRALGNSVVPQCAEVVGWVVRELMH